MTKFPFVFFVLFGALSAAEPLTVKEQAIYAIASFDAVDYFTTFSSEGEFLWEISFGTKIESFQETGDRLIFLSKMRDGSAYFVTCVESEKGKLIWEKTIFSPQLNQEDRTLPTDLP